MAQSDDYRLRVASAKNPSTTPEILDTLSHDHTISVKCSVGYNKNTSPQTLELLAKDKDRRVRSAVAGNINTPYASLNKLRDDSDGTTSAIADATLCIKEFEEGENE
jgi:hypothetical protein